MSYKILIIEDEKSISELLKGYLEHNSYIVNIAEDGLKAIQLFSDFMPDLVILDRMLPGISGDQVCQEIRTLSDVPILMLTAKSTEESKLEGFELGVDDYVTKPFSAKEVVFRVKALLKRVYKESTSDIESVDDLDINIKRRTIHKFGNEIYLTANEFEIFEVLFKNRPIPLTRSQIVEDAFGYGYEAYERNMDTYIKNIRHKIEIDPKSPKYILTKYGVGYYFRE